MQYSKALCFLCCTGLSIMVGCGENQNSISNQSFIETESSIESMPVTESDTETTKKYLWETRKDFLDCFVKYGYDYGVQEIIESQIDAIDYEYTFNNILNYVSIYKDEEIDFVFITNKTPSLSENLSNEDAQEYAVKPVIPVYCALNHTVSQTDIDVFMKGFVQTDKNTYKQKIDDIVYEYGWGDGGSFFLIGTLALEKKMAEIAHHIQEPDDVDISMMSDEDKSRIQSALESTRFPTSPQSSFISMQDAIEDTFRDYSMSATLTDSNTAMGYYQYKVTVTGNYFRDASFKKNGETAEGSIHYLIMYMMGDLSTCSPEVDDIAGDVYNSMTRIIYGT